MSRSDVMRVHVHALSAADELGFRAQEAVSQAMGDQIDYRLVDGQMVRLLLAAYPTSAAVQRATLDADAAVGEIEVIAPLSKALEEARFEKVGGNVFVKGEDPANRLEINILLAEGRTRPGLSTVMVQGVGQVDTLPELVFAMMHPPLVLGVVAHMMDGSLLEYDITIPDLESATVLKAHAWKARREEKDVADLHSLLELRHEHPTLAWRLHEEPAAGRRLDTARALAELRTLAVERRPSITFPAHVPPQRLAALIGVHIARA